MKDKLIVPDYLFEVSWEVCNKVGGIYAVLSTKAATLKASLGDNLVFIGPDIWHEQPSPFFIEGATHNLTKWETTANEKGLKERIGRREIHGQPLVVLDH